MKCKWSIDRQVRLYTDLPYPNETWSSFLDRVTATYQINRDSLYAQLLGSSARQMRLHSAGALHPWLHRALASALNIPETFFPNDARGIGYRSLSAYRQTSYCPLCFLEDLEQRRSPYFRFQWSIPDVTCCRVHRSPLMRWRQVRVRDQRILPFGWSVDPKPTRAAECTWLDDDLQVVDAARNAAEEGSHPLALVRRLEDDLVEIEDEIGRWGETHCEPHHYAIRLAMRIGAARLRQDATPLADALRPTSFGESLFAGAHDRAVRPLKRTHYAFSHSPLKWRRSILWFAARLHYRCFDDIPTHVGEVIARGGRSSMIGVIRCVADPDLYNDVDTLDDAFRRARLEAIRRAAWWGGSNRPKADAISDDIEVQYPA